MAAYATGGLNLAGGAEPIRATITYATDQFFETLGRPALILLATQGEKSAQVKQRRSSVSVAVPQHMVMNGWSVSPDQVTQPFRLTLAYRYPKASPSKSEIAKADAAALKQATALAKELAHRLPQGEDADRIRFP